MPRITESTYQPPFGLSNGHLQTIYAHFRRVNGVQYRRERIVTADEDFLDLDWSEAGAGRIAILSHGLEGSTQRHYVLGMTKALNRHGWNVLAWNYRGCSGESNKRLRWYHSGETGDLDAIIRHAALRQPSEIALVGFSLGGNITLKYLGERGKDRHPLVSKAVAFSVPCDLESSAIKLADRSNILYMRRFLKSLRAKIRAKMELYPDDINDANFDSIRTFIEFDDRYTAPIHGFRDAYDYFEKSSSRPLLRSIRVPTLLVNAKNDPFLALPSFPYADARNSSFFFFEAPSSGGHMGFVTFGNGGEFWSESRAAAFLENPTEY